jgi:hypothetical protein
MCVCVVDENTCSLGVHTEPVACEEASATSAPPQLRRKGASTLQELPSYKLDLQRTVVLAVG